VQNEVFGYKTRMLSAEEVRRDYVNEAEAVGALLDPLGTGVHAAKLAFGYQRMARELGAKVHPGSPVLEITTAGGIHSLRTPGGTVRVRAVGIATGAYTAGGLTPLLRGRCMPILSNSIVTRPLTEAGLQLTRQRKRRPAEYDRWAAYVFPRSGT
jgi:glycine/D-amino acid oxidase-like deaminating enzyme